MSWSLEQSIDAAFVAFLKPQIPGSMRAYPSCTNEVLQFPCVVIHTGGGRNENDDIGFNGHRRHSVYAVVMVEMAPELDSKGVVVRSPIQRVSDARDAVMGALARRWLERDLNEIQPDGVRFSYALVTETTDPTIEGRVFHATITIEVIANPTP